MDATDTKNKLARAITAEQLQEFLEELARTPGVDGPMIREQAQAKFGISIGNDSANQFKKEVFGKYLESVRKAREMSKIVAAQRDEDSGRTLADAASEVLQQRCFEFLVDNTLNLGEKDGLKRAEALSRIIKSARSEDRRMIEQLTEELKEAREREKETKEDLKNNTLSDEEREARMRARFGV